MATQTLDLLHVMPGYRCNLFCNHCVNDSGPKQTYALSEAEIEALRIEIQRFRPRQLLFTGGEPTLHIDIINRLIESHPDLTEADVQITTNGAFAISPEATRDTLGRFKKLSSVQLSFDQFHGARQNINLIHHLLAYCRERGLRFNISMTISTPEELLQAQPLLKQTEAPIIFQKVEASGRAKKTQKQFRYPSFDSAVLERKCPNLGQISYIAGKGFTTCCSNLVFNGHNLEEETFHPTVDGHFTSVFFGRLNGQTFAEMLRDRGITEEAQRAFPADFTAPCRLCEFVHSGK